MKYSKISNLPRTIYSDAKSSVKHITGKLRRRRRLRRWIKRDVMLNDAKGMLRDSSHRNYREDIRAYWRHHYGQSVNPLWHLAFTKATGVHDVRYIPGYIWWCEILPYFNDLSLRPAFLDKNLSDAFLDYTAAPETIVKRMHGHYYEGGNKPLLSCDVERHLATFGDTGLIIKSSRTDDGRGIRSLEAIGSTLLVNGERSTLGDLEKLYGNNFIVQEKLVQHSHMAQIHPASLNTIRVVTFRWGDKIRLLKSFARFGTGGSLNDNLGTGGLGCGIDDEGRLYDTAADIAGKMYSRHPTTGYSFAERMQVPNYKDACAMALEMHRQIFHFDIVSWDIAIGIHGNPIFLEVNFQGGAEGYQTISKLPLFGDLTDEVLESIRDRS